MQFHSHANQSHFHKNGFALRLALKQRHKGTRKWPIATYQVETRCHTETTMLYVKIKAYDTELTII